MAGLARRLGFLLRVPRPLLDELRRWADREMRSVNGQIEWILRDALRRHGRTADRAVDRARRRGGERRGT